MISRSRLTEISLLVGRVRSRSTRTPPPPPWLDWNAPSSDGLSSKRSPLRSQLRGYRGRARHERITQLRQADRVLLVGESVCRVPARLAEEALDHRAVVAAQVIGEADLRRQRLGVRHGRRLDVTRRDERGPSSAGRSSPRQRRDAVRRRATDPATRPCSSRMRTPRFSVRRLFIFHVSLIQPAV